jgi:hypothetical protein
VNDIYDRMVAQVDELAEGQIARNAKIQELERRAEYLQAEINLMRRAMQQAGTWDQFCADYAAYKEARSG